MNVETINGLIFFVLGLTFLTFTSKTKIIGVITVIPCVILAVEFNNFMSIAFSALALLNGAYALFGND